MRVTGESKVVTIARAPHEEESSEDSESENSEDSSDNKEIIEE